MAWSFGDGFDLYATITDATSAGYWDATSVNGSNTITSPGRFTGSQALRMVSSSGNLTKTSGVNDAVHHLVVAFTTNVAISGATTTTFFQLLDGTTAQCTIVFRTDGAILLKSGSVAGATLATYTGAFTATSTWYAFEFEIVINNTTGRFRVRKNGNPIDDFDSGAVLNTRGGTANNYANKLTISMDNGVNAQIFDDLYWRSDAASVPWLGDIRCYTRMPASDQSVQFSRTPTVVSQTVPPSGTITTSNIANTTARFTPFVASLSGTVTSVSVSVTTGNSGNMKCAIYTDNAGVPGTVISSATAPVTPVAAGANVFTFSPGVTVVKGAQYWVAAMADTSTGTYTSVGAIGANASASYATFPQNNPVATTGQATVQMQWTYSTTSNWPQVAEAQQDATTSYVYDSTPGDADFYGIATIASTPVSTIAVTTRGYMQKSDAGTRTAAVQLKSGASTVASPTLTLTTSGWQWAWRTDTVDPNTSAAWTAAAVNNAQVGPKVIA